MNKKKMNHNKNKRIKNAKRKMELGIAKPKRTVHMTGKRMKKLQKEKRRLARDLKAAGIDVENTTMKYNKEDDKSSTKPATKETTMVDKEAEAKKELAKQEKNVGMKVDSTASKKNSKKKSNKGKKKTDGAAAMEM